MSELKIDYEKAAAFVHKLIEQIREQDKRTAHDVMTSSQAATYLNISIRQLHNLETNELLPVRRLGGSKRYFKTDLDKWSAARMTGVAG